MKFEDQDPNFFESEAGIAVEAAQAQHTAVPGERTVAAMVHTLA